MTFFGQVVQKYPYQQGGIGGNEGVDAEVFLAATRESLGILGKPSVLICRYTVLNVLRCCV